MIKNWNFLFYDSHVHFYELLIVFHFLGFYSGHKTKHNRDPRTARSELVRDFLVSHLRSHVLRTKLYF